MVLHHVLPTWNVFWTTLFLLTTISIRHFKESQYTDVYQLRQTTTATIDYNSANKAETETAALCTISNTYANITKGTIIVIIESLLFCISLPWKLGHLKMIPTSLHNLCEYSNNGFLRTMVYEEKYSAVNWDNLIGKFTSFFRCQNTIKFRGFIE